MGGEKISTGVITDGDNDGSISLDVSVSVGAVIGNTFARFRWSTTAALDLTSANVVDREVEDYRIGILGIPELCLRLM